jgi:hypothetical protein
MKNTRGTEDGANSGRGHPSLLFSIARFVWRVVASPWHGVVYLWCKIPCRWRGIGMLVLHLAVVVVVGYMSFGLGLNPSPDKHAQPGQCVDILTKDDLRHLALRTRADQQRQLDRWDRCDSQARRRARDTLPKDDVQIAVIGFGLAMAVVRCWRRIRWRLAAYIGGLLGALYVVADITENLRLDHVLATDRASAFLHWPAAIKFGALLGALPVFLVSLCYSFSEAWQPRAVTPTEVHWSALPDFLGRWWFRSFDKQRRPHAVAPAPAEAEGVDIDMGVCCSGGGIRSAAFSLGALQALDDQEGGRELTSAKWLSAVSGGSYLAAAWTSARAIPLEKDSGQPFYQLPWSRRSPEEDHLRRHSSYLAPGVGGKLWALARYFLGLTLNLAVVALALLVSFLPYGWVVSRYEQPKLLGKGNQIALPAGGCLQLPDGLRIAAVPGTTLLLASASELQLDPNAPAGPPAPPSPKKEKSSGHDERRHSPGDKRRSTTTTSLPSPPAPTTTTCPTRESAAPPSGASSPPAGKPLRRLDKGTQVDLVLDKPLPVRGRDIAACSKPGEPESNPSTTTTSPQWTCTANDADVFQFREPVRLVSAPTVVLTLNHDAIVVRPGGQDVPEGGTDAADAPNARLVRSCGSHPCQRSAAPTWLTALALVTSAVAVFIGLALLVVRPRRTTARRVTGLLKVLGTVAFLLLVFTFLLPYLVVAAEDGRWWLEDRLRFELPGAGVGVLVLALVSQIGAFTGSPDSAPSGVQSALKSLGTKLRPVIVKLAAVFAGPLLLLLAAVLIASYGAEHAFGSGQAMLWIAAVGTFAALLAGGDLNEWSLHPFYRDRLREGFVGGEPPPEQAEYIDYVIPNRDPKLLVCAAANIADDRATPPGRPVAPWVFSRDSIGSAALGRVASGYPLKENKGKKIARTGTVRPTEFPRGLSHLTSLWEAVAVSGAAFSPAMGKMTKPERALFALGNLRLGVWYPNPAYLECPAGQRVPGQPKKEWYDRHHPRPWYLAKEAFGFHRATDPWIYVTDGGHYENLGLVELLRRGCREIYCFDGSGDTASTFGTLADAMRLAREELDVEITFDPTHMKADKDGISEFGVWAGTVRYPTPRDDDAAKKSHDQVHEAEPEHNADEKQRARKADEQRMGWIVIAKLEVPKEAPFDIVDLARTLPKFPSNPTSDQLYTDQKFEAYRALGHYLGMQAKKLGTDIRTELARPEEPPADKDKMTSAVDNALRKRVPDPTKAALKIDVALQKPADG